MANKKSLPVTQDYLQDSFDKFEKTLDKRFMNQEKRLIKILEDRVVGRIIDEFKKTQEEQEVHQFSHARINDDLEELQTRIDKLEQPHS